MLKSGKYRAFRNLPVGWFTQAIHSTDTSERIFRLFVEFLFLLLAIRISVALNFAQSTLSNFILPFFLIHTCNWFLTGNFWVYMLDSFKWIKNPGIDKIIEFIQLTERLFTSGKYCDAILIYGSMCRSEFHIRSDLDLRIVRRTDSWQGLVSLPVAFLLRAYSFFIMLPVDLQVIDNCNFLSKQMRDDEKPIIVHLRKGVTLQSKGLSFEQIIKSPHIVLRKSPDKP